MKDSLSTDEDTEKIINILTFDELSKNGITDHCFAICISEAVASKNSDHLNALNATLMIARLIDPKDIKHIDDLRSVASLVQAIVDGRLPIKKIIDESLFV